MINIATLAQTFEDGLNAILNEPQLSFKIWATTGERDKPFREGNKVYEYITGNLRVSSTSNSANLLVMGVSGFTLEFALHVQRPRTNANQTHKSFMEIEDGLYKYIADEQYTYINYIISVIDRYFRQAKTITLEDEESGKTYSVGISAGTAVSGDIDLVSKLDNYVPITTYIEFVYAESGINSKDVTITLNGRDLPFNVVKVNRAAEMVREVSGDNLVSKNLTTSTAFAIDSEFPSTTIDTETTGYLLNGSPNTAYFVKVSWGTVLSSTYLMTFNSGYGSAQGVLCAGFGATLVEVTENVELLEFPDNYQVGKFAFSDSNGSILTFTTSIDCTAYICGRAYLMEKGSQNVTVTPSDFEYSEEDDKYYIYLVTDKAVSVSESSNSFSVED